VPVHQRGKGGLGIGRRIFPQQGQVVIHVLTGIWPPTGKANRLFYEGVQKRRRAAALQDAGAKVGRVTPCAPPDTL
jgi:hypothetical protein